MSQNQRRSRNGVSSTRIQPSILKARKRKISGNEIDTSPNIPFKEAKLEMGPATTLMPLEDVTLSSLNITKDPKPTPTPEKKTQENWQKFQGLSCFPTPQSKRRVPFPSFSWGDREQVWELMCRKDALYKTDPNYLSRHPALQPRMRAILLDWLTEVCEVYKLHRETYYLAINYVDRYLSAMTNVPKQQLQLIGITCLFIAAKIEEIYPPKLSEFSYVTDGACMDNDILEKELVVVKCLNWDLNPITSICWLNTYLQLFTDYLKKEAPEELLDNRSSHDNNFMFPQYSGLTFVQVARQLDLCMLDMGSLRFSTSRLAAAALCFTVSMKYTSLVSGYTNQDLQECCDWMAAFAVTAQENGQALLKIINQIPLDDSHNIQTHIVDLEMLERAQLRQNQLESWRLSPPVMQTPIEALTPPKTDEKIRNAPDD